MKKLAILFLTLFLVGLPMATRAESLKEKRDDTRYLAGAVPEVDGKVVFSKEFQIPGMSQAQIYDTMKKWITERLKENNNQESRVVYENQAEGTIAGIGEEWLVVALSWKRFVITTAIRKIIRLKNGSPISMLLRKTKRNWYAQWQNGVEKL